MAQVYFHCSNSREIRIDQSGVVVSDLTEARDHAACVVQSMIRESSAEDEIFEVSFSSVLGKPH